MVQWKTAQDVDPLLVQKINAGAIQEHCFSPSQERLALSIQECGPLCRDLSFQFEPYRPSFFFDPCDLEHLHILSVPRDAIPFSNSNATAITPRRTHITH
jgi:hypothetical protein